MVELKKLFFEALGGVCALCRKLLHSDKLLKHLHLFFSTCSLSFHFLFLNINFFGRDQCAPISVKCPRTHKEVAKKLFFNKGKDLDGSGGRRHTPLPKIWQHLQT